MRNKSVFPALREQYFRELQRLWPALKGSVAAVRKPCVRPNCPACARGDKHLVWTLSLREQGRRRCLYVPAELVPLLQQAVANGRRLEQLLYQMGPALLRQHREQRTGHRQPAARP